MKRLHSISLNRLCDSDMENHETPMMEAHHYGSPHSDGERKNPGEFSNFLSPEDPIELVERSLNEPPSKQIFAWFQEIIQDAERHGAPLCSYT